MDGWLEFDLDSVASSNTGVFANTPIGSPDRMVNADGKQLAFLGSQKGNALEQDLAAAYRVGCDYRLTVAVGVSSRFPPSAACAGWIPSSWSYTISMGTSPWTSCIGRSRPNGQSSTQLQDFSVVLPTVRPGDAWAGKTIGVAIRAAGAAGGFWDLDNVRLVESLPTAIPVANASFEAPTVDPNGFGAWPFVDGWLELDLDSVASANTGVFANTPVGSPDRMINAEGKQLAFLGSQQGNALEQDLAAVFKAGCDYRLTVGVGVSSRFPPAGVAVTPAKAGAVDTIELVLYYLDGAKPVDIAHQTVEAQGPVLDPTAGFLRVSYRRCSPVTPGRASPSAWRSERPETPAGSGMWTTSGWRSHCR